jgi:putative phosphoribosyl transferase
MAEMRFQNRADAGRALGARLAELAPVNPLVLALPRGGVPVGFEVARALGCELDLLMVRKLGVPGQPELAMGALAEDDVVIRNEVILGLAGVDEESFERALEAERQTMARRAAMYRADQERLDPQGHTVLVVDDGLATGATALAAIETLRLRGADEVWLCVPVAPADTVEVVGSVADRVVVLSQPRRFSAVGAWYNDFSQTEDEEVRSLLARSRLR